MTAEEPDAESARGDTVLSDQLGAAMVRLIREGELPAGSRLTERALAARFKVSRSPIRRALQRLSASGLVQRTETGRYHVADGVDTVAPPVLSDPTSEEADYIRLAEDRLEGRVPDRISESALARRYGLTSTRVRQLLRRVSNEGWAEPLPGHGWEFLPVLTSLRSYQDSYRFRLMVEPRAILEPTFELNRVEMAKRRDEQQRIVDGGAASISEAQLYELNTRFHGTIAECSGNGFIVDSLERINRLRRLMEYRQALNPERAVVRCQEHVTLAGLLLADRRLDASDFLREHLSTVSAEKAG